MMHTFRAAKAHEEINHLLQPTAVAPSFCDLAASETNLRLADFYCNVLFQIPNLSQEENLQQHLENIYRFFDMVRNSILQLAYHAASPRMNAVLA